jgi:hypothetical protein
MAVAQGLGTSVRGETSTHSSGAGRFHKGGPRGRVPQDILFSERENTISLLYILYMSKLWHACAGVCAAAASAVVSASVSCLVCMLGGSECAHVCCTILALQPL